MKKILLTILAVLLAFCLLCGCGKSQASSPVVEEPSTQTETPSVETAPAEPSDDTAAAEPEEDSSSAPAVSPYTQQIERYHAALSEAWDESTYFENEMCHMAVYYYEGNALDNVGYTLMDLDGDGSDELVIGAVKNSDLDPLVFEVWTLKDGAPVMLAQSGSRNRYYLQFAEDDGIWTIANEAENGAANHAVYYLQLSEGELNVVQGVVFDAMASESAPWFMAYDLDWDVSNDTPTDEDAATAVMEAERNRYTAAEYTPYSLCK